MQGEERVVFLLRKEVVLRKSELYTEQECEYTTNKEEEEPEQEVQNSDFFVIGCGQPRLEVAPETSNCEGVRATSVEDPHCSKKNNGKGQSNCCEQDLSLIHI